MLPLEHPIWSAGCNLPQSWWWGCASPGFSNTKSFFTLILSQHPVSHCSSTKFSHHCSFFPERTVTVMFAQWWSSDSIISTFINWKPSVRKSAPFSNYVCIWLFIVFVWTQVYLGYSIGHNPFLLFLCFSFYFSFTVDIHYHCWFCCSNCSRFGHW